jgi:opacity protein-like surface antigen
MKRLAATGVALLAFASAGLSPADPLDFSLGPAGGYLRMRGADRGTWFAGAQARLRVIDYLGAEASITFHQSDFESGDAVVTQYPVQLTGLVYPVPNSSVQPYGLLGAGWYYTRINYIHGLSSLDTETDHTFGFHLGGGVDLKIGLWSSLYADFRYIFLHKPSIDYHDLAREKFDSWQVTFGFSFGF